MRSLSGKVLWFWVFLLICYPLLVWTTGWIRSKKRLGSWKDHEATAPVRCAKNLFNSMAVHWAACASRVFIRFWGYKIQNTFLHIFTAKAYHMLQKNQKIQNTLLHIFTHFYTCVSGFFLGLHMCKWIFFGLHMCKWIFLLTYTFLHIHTHPYTFRYIVVFLVHSFRNQFS